MTRRAAWLAAVAILGTVLLASLGAALAHPMLVIGEVTFEPDPPVPGEPSELTLILQDTALAEVEDAVIFLELREGEPGTEDGEPRGEPLVATDRLDEVSPGVYVTTLTFPSDGVYTLSIRDRTYRQEEAIANLAVVLDGEPVDFVPFVLPPTATGPIALGSWLIWLVGVPLLAGVVVTVLVMRSGRGEPGGEPDVEGAPEGPAAED